MAKKKKVEKHEREFTRRQLSQFRRQKRRQRIIFISGVTIISVAVVIVLVGWLVGEFIPMHKNIIRVGDYEFNTGYYIDMVKINGRNEPSQRIELVASNTARQIEQMALIRMGAKELGLEIDDEEAKKMVEDVGLEVNDASVDFARNQILQQRLVSAHFNDEVAESDKQVHIMTMLVESERVADELRERLVSGENITALSADFALNYYSKEVNQGDFGWHPETILENMLGSTVPVNYAFGAEPGAISRPLIDEATYKNLGYWLIKVAEKQFEEEAQVQALLLNSEEEAEAIKERLEAGEDLAALAEEYSDYSPSQEKGGELGLVAQGDITDALDEYVFSPETEIGVWSGPVREDTLWTQGGYWLVQMIDTDDDRKLSSEDRDELISMVFSDWITQLQQMYISEIDSTRLTSEVQQFVIDRVLSELETIER